MKYFETVVVRLGWVRESIVKESGVVQVERSQELISLLFISHFIVSEGIS